MNTTEQEVKVISVSLLCEECDGEMSPTGTVLTSNPPQYPHACLNGHIINIFGEPYPRIKYKPIK